MNFKQLKSTKKKTNLSRFSSVMTSKNFQKKKIKTYLKRNVPQLFVEHNEAVNVASRLTLKHRNTIFLRFRQHFLRYHYQSLNFCTTIRNLCVKCPRTCRKRCWYSWVKCPANIVLGLFWFSKNPKIKKSNRLEIITDFIAYAKPLITRSRVPRSSL